MYGKFFASTFTGSMFGAGPDVFAVWGYVIANTVESTIELNPNFLAAVIGATPDRIATAIAHLCKSDDSSRSTSEGGKRIVHEGAFQYRVVNHAHYRALRNEDDRRAYNREAQKRSRSKRVKRSVNDSHQMSALSAHTEAEAEAEANQISSLLKPIQIQHRDDVTVIKTPRHKPALTARDEAFESFWLAYPKKTGKGAALKAWQKSPPTLAVAIDALKWQVSQPQWLRDQGQYIPHASTWLNQRRWEDAPFHPPQSSTIDTRTKGGQVRDAIAQAMTMDTRRQPLPTLKVLTNGR